MSDSKQLANHRNALFVANHSGGKDSQAMLIKLLSLVPASQILVVHATLGEFEWPGALELAKKQAADAGCDFVVAEASKTFLEMVERRFEKRPEVPCWPSSATRQCTSDLKRGPCEREIRRYMKAHGYTTVINCMGFRAEESSARAKREVFRRVDRNCTQTREWYEHLPIHDYSKAEVFSAIANAGQQAHEAYSKGNDRLSCMFCIMACDKDIQNGARHNPTLFKKLAAMERRTGYTMHMSRRSLTEIVAAA